MFKSRGMVYLVASAVVAVCAVLAAEAPPYVVGEQQPTVAYDRAFTYAIYPVEYGN